MSDFIQGKLDKIEGTRIGLVTARFNRDVTKKLEEGAIEALLKIGYSKNELSIVRVPGVVEIPLMAKTLLEENCDGIVVLGVVIRGETSHYDYVCQSVERGITHLILEYSAPIGFGVLTTEDKTQALERAGGRKGNKGFDAAEVTVEMLNSIRILKK